ncbi:MAG: amidohydrolase family protein [Dehalococcoidia bacterium]|nr:amidohydrolase family protein [Dehalococcoidia bacterium]
MTPAGEHPVIVDFHTHIFPPAVVRARDRFLARDEGFKELYSNPRARLATAEDLLRSMDDSEVDISVVQGFGWSSHDLCRAHNDYLLEAAARSNGRLLAFCTLQPLAREAALGEAERVAAAGAAGLGELRPHTQGYSLASAEGELLSGISERLGLPLLFHVSEPVGHRYPGKSGLPMAEFYEFARDHPGCRIIGAHWGGGLPLYGVMPELRTELASTWFDTAASSLLYRDRIYEAAIEALGADRILFASDYPLLNQSAQLQTLRALEIDEDHRRAIAGANAAGLLRIGA